MQHKQPEAAPAEVAAPVPPEPRRPRRRQIPAVFSSLFFLAGGVAAYMAGHLTPPFYLAGSAVMLAGALAGIRDDQMSSSPAVITRRSAPVWMWVAPPAAIVLGFSLGLRL